MYYLQQITVLLQRQVPSVVLFCNSSLKTLYFQYNALSPGSKIRIKTEVIWSISTFHTSATSTYSHPLDTASHVFTAYLQMMASMQSREVTTSRHQAVKTVTHKTSHK